MATDQNAKKKLFKMFLFTTLIFFDNLPLMFNLNSLINIMLIYESSQIWELKFQ